MNAGWVFSSWVRLLISFCTQWCWMRIPPPPYSLIAQDRCWNLIFPGPTPLTLDSCSNCIIIQLLSRLTVTKTHICYGGNSLFIRIQFMCFHQASHILLILGLLQRTKGKYTRSCKRKLQNQRFFCFWSFPIASRSVPSTSLCSHSTFHIFIFKSV